jgi:hypothetical protein
MPFSAATGLAEAALAAGTATADQRQADRMQDPANLPKMMANRPKRVFNSRPKARNDSFLPIGYLSVRSPARPNEGSPHFSKVYIRMLPGRSFAVVAAAFVSAAVGFFQMSPVAAASDTCAAEVTVLPSPLAPWTGAPLRVMVVSGKPVDGALSLIAPDGKVAAKSTDRHDGPPYSWFAEVAAPTAGTWHATLERGSAGCSPVSRDIAVSARKPEPLRIPAGSIWQARNSWNSTNEALFSAWIEKLFDAPPDQDLNWKVWYEVLRDPARNFLYNHLGRLFCLQDGAAVRLFELLAWFRRQTAEVLPMVRRRASRSHASASATRSGRRGRSRGPDSGSAAANAEPVAVVWPGGASGRATRDNATCEGASAEAEASNKFWRISA